MKIELTREQEEFVREQLARGAYASAEEVVASALGMMRRQEEAVAQIRAEVQKAYESIEREGTYSHEEVMERLRARQRVIEENAG